MVRRQPCPRKRVVISRAARPRQTGTHVCQNFRQEFADTGDEGNRAVNLRQRSLVLMVPYLTCILSTWYKADAIASLVLMVPYLTCILFTWYKADARASLVLMVPYLTCILSTWYIADAIASIVLMIPYLT